jgi:hypothetical protein
MAISALRVPNAAAGYAVEYFSTMKYAFETLLVQPLSSKSSRPNSQFSSSSVLVHGISLLVGLSLWLSTKEAVRCTSRIHIGDVRDR